MPSAGRGDRHSTGVATASAPLLISRDPRIIDSVLAACTSQGITPELARDDAAVQRWWRSARLVLVGCDQAPVVAGLGLPVRTGVHLVGHRRDELVGWSVPLDASVIVLPEHSALLGSVLEARSDGGPGAGRLVRVVGGSGGVGASTLTAALAQVASARVPAVAVELDPCGGGLDLLFGAEAAPGWRWGDLRAAAGHVEGLAGRLPNVSGPDVLAHGRTSFPAPRPRLRRGAARDDDIASAPEPPGPEAVRAVLSALTRSHRLVALDCGHAPVTVGEQWSSTRTLCVVSASVRGIVAARARFASMGLIGAGVVDAGLVVRSGAGRGVDPAAAAQALTLPLVGVLTDDRALLAGSESGDPPGRARGRHRKQVEQILAAVMGGDLDEAGARHDR